MVQINCKEFNDSDPISEKQAWELEYRRGYADGWIQAIKSMQDSMLSHGLSRRVAFDRCYDYWQFPLTDWAVGACEDSVLPPATPLFPVKEKGDQNE